MHPPIVDWNGNDYLCALGYSQLKQRLSIGCSDRLREWYDNILRGLTPQIVDDRIEPQSFLFIVSV